MLGIVLVNLWHMMGINIEYSLAIECAYFRPIWSIYCPYLGHILGIPCAKVGHFVFLSLAYPGHKVSP
jgi:hypothetical protein